MHVPSPISLVAANLEAEAGAAGALFSWILLFVASYFISRFLIRKLRPGSKPSKSAAVVYFLGVFMLLTLATSMASYWLFTKATAEKAAVMAVEKNWGKKTIDDRFSGTLWTRLDGSKVLYRFALDQEPFPKDVGGQGFALLDSKGAKYCEQVFFYDDFTMSKAQDGTDVWLADGIMEKRMNLRTYESVKDWMIGVIPR